MMRQQVLDNADQDGLPSFDALLGACQQAKPEENQVDGLVRQVLRAMLEERRTRQPSARRPSVTRSKDPADANQPAATANPS